MKKFYLLIGGNGFIGSHFQIELKRKELPFLVVDKEESKIVDNPFIKGSFEQNFELVLEEIEKISDINATIEIHHLAADVGVNSILNNKDYFNEELILSYTINQFLKKLKEKRKNINFIYYSTSEVYGDLPYQFENKDTQEPSIEDSRFLRNRYNVFKTFGEYYFKDICKQLDINYLVIRPYNVVGPGQREVFVIPKMVKEAVLDRKITVYGNGEQKRIFIHVEDFVDSVMKAVDKILDKKEKDFEILNVANVSNYASIKKLAKMIADRVSYEIKEIVEIEYKEVNQELIGQEKRIPDTQRLYTELKIRPQKKLDKIIIEYIRWYLNS